MSIEIERSLSISPFTRIFTRGLNTFGISCSVFGILSNDHQGRIPVPRPIMLVKELGKFVITKVTSS